MLLNRENTSEVASDNKSKWCFLLHYLYQILFGHSESLLKLGPVLLYVCIIAAFPFSWGRVRLPPFLQPFPVENLRSFKSDLGSVLKSAEEKCSSPFGDWHMAVTELKKSYLQNSSPSAPQQGESIAFWPQHL